MLTIKYTDNRGVTFITECKHVRVDKLPDNRTRVTTYEEYPIENGSNQTGVFAGDPDQDNTSLPQTLYVMNERGNTVGSYLLD